MPDATLIQGNLLLYPEEDSADESSIYFYDDISLSNLPVGQSVTVRLESQDFTPYLELRGSDDFRQFVCDSELFWGGEGAIAPSLP